MIVSPNTVSFQMYNGYIAGTGDGIVTVAGKPAARPIYLYLVTSGMAKINLVARQVSSKDGHYMFTGLNPTKRYMVMARDHKYQYEPFVWDDIVPATDLNIEEQQILRQLWREQ